MGSFNARPPYLDHILSLDFQTIAVTKTEKYSYLNACHRNCENFCQENRGNHVLGWLRVQWGEGVRYLLHSCVMQDGVLKDITPRLLNEEGSFAIDPRISIDPAITHEFAFQDKQGEENISKYYDMPDGSEN